MFAFGLLALGSKGKPLIDGIHSVAQVLFKMIGFVMWIAPIGASLFRAIAAYGRLIQPILAALAGQAGAESSTFAACFL